MTLVYVCSWSIVDCFRAYEVGYLHAEITYGQCFKYQACPIELHKSAHPYSSNVRCKLEYSGDMPVIPNECRRRPIPCPWQSRPAKHQPYSKAIAQSGLNTCMQTFQASVRVRVDGRSQIVQTQIRAPNSNDARWLLWAQFGFHSITSGPNQVKQ
jgi:hypothetical protein